MWVYKELKRLSKDYKNWIKKENESTCKEFAISSVGKVDPKRHLLENVSEIQERSILHTYGLMSNSKVF